jgi:hypothetical protein
VITTTYQKATDIRPCFLLQRLPQLLLLLFAVQKGEKKRERERERNRVQEEGSM